ncbi:MAG: PTS sugar transporter subunit IIA [Pseudomonadota bacterium]
MKLSDILKPNSVLCNVEARSKKHAIEVVAKLICRDREQLAETDTFSSLIDRERLGCTALASGIAVPHARVTGIDAPAGSLIQLSTPIEFDKIDDTDVDLIVGVVVPQNYATDTDDNSFRDLVADLSNAKRLAALRAASSSSELYDAAVAHYDDQPIEVADDTESLPRQAARHR